MNGISDFIQDNWYELGSLIAQFAIAAMFFWYGRMWLRRERASEEQPEPSAGKANTAAASVPAMTREPETAAEPYEIPAYAAARQREQEPELRPHGFSAFALGSDGETGRGARPEFPPSTRASLQEMEQTARRYEIPPPVFAAPEPVAAGHGGVGRMLSPLPEADAPQAEPVRQPRSQRTGVVRAVIKWLRGPMYSSRRVVKRAA